MKKQFFNNSTTLPSHPSSGICIEKPTLVVYLLQLIHTSLLKKENICRHYMSNYCPLRARSTAVRRSRTRHMRMTARTWLWFDYRETHRYHNEARTIFQARLITSRTTALMTTNTIPLERYDGVIYRMKRLKKKNVESQTCTAGSCRALRAIFAVLFSQRFDGHSTPLTLRARFTCFGVILLHC